MTVDVGESARVRTPVEHRWFGLDARTFRPALIVLAIALALIYGLQGLDSAVPWRDAIRAGDVLDLGSGATAVPPVGWQLEAGSLVGSPEGASPQVVLATGGVTADLQVVAFTGTASSFLDQVQRAEGPVPSSAAGGRSTLTTDAGVVGVAQSITSPSEDRLQATFKLADGAGSDTATAPALLVEVRSAPGQFEQYRDAVTQLLRSVTPVATR